MGKASVVFTPTGINAAMIDISVLDGDMTGGLLVKPSQTYFLGADSNSTANYGAVSDGVQESKNVNNVETILSALPLGDNCSSVPLGDVNNKCSGILNNYTLKKFTQIIKNI